MDVRDLLSDQIVNEEMCKLISFEDAILIEEAFGKERTFPCTFRIKDRRGHIYTLQGVNPDTIRAYYLIKDQNAEKIFFKAAKKGDVKTISTLLKIGVNPNFIKKFNYPPLTWAAKNGHVEVIRILLENGANINTMNRSGYTALMLATQYGHTEVVKLLLENKADVNIITKTKSTALIFAAQQGFLEILKLLIEYKANINIVDENNYTALIWATFGNHISIVKFLLDHGADLNVSQNGRIALYSALRLGHREIVDLLVERGVQ